MNIQEVTITGFKSFGRPQTFTFKPGFNMIVGPDGGGKTSLIEALLWASGQIDHDGSSKDFYFKGAASLKPAEQILVSLTIAKEGSAFSLSRFASKNQSLSHFRLGEESAPIEGFLEQFQDQLPTIRLIQDHQTLLTLVRQNQHGEILVVDELDREITPDEAISFIQSLEHLGKKNQLIVVTHSKATMELADQIMGVTMEEYGVSAIVAMRLRNDL